MDLWRCTICGCDYDEAQAKRRRRGERAIRQVGIVVCSAACWRKRESLQTMAWQRRNWRRYLAAHKLAARRRRRRR